ncbi:MAG TPA: hypothetical protein VIU38_09095 [Anaerolineales bacterium]
MKFQTLMVIKAAVCLALGVPILLAPDFVYSVFGLSLAAAGAFAAREYGASLIGNLMITWYARNAADSEARQAIILGLCVYDALGFLATLAAQLSGLLNPLGWSVVVLYLFFAVGFGYFLVNRPHPVTRASTA